MVADLLVAMPAAVAAVTEATEARVRIPAAAAVDTEALEDTVAAVTAPMVPVVMEWAELQLEAPVMAR